jgi:hypothetical protein
VNIRAKHGWPGTAAILISVGLHGSVYALLRSIEGPAPVDLTSEPLMAYIVPASLLYPEPLPAPAEPVAPEETIEAPLPEAERPPAPEPEQPAETRTEPPPVIEPRPESTGGPTETATEGSEARPSVTRFEWYAAIPEAIARIRAAEEDAPLYREFGNLDALTAGARTATDWALDPSAEGIDALPFETTSWGDERTWINENCYVSRPAPGTVLAEVHRFNNPMINCERSSRTEPQDDLFIEARPAYLEDD